MQELIKQIRAMACEVFDAQEREVKNDAFLKLMNKIDDAELNASRLEFDLDMLRKGIHVESTY